MSEPRTAAAVLRERGAVLLEAAIAIPLLLLLMFGTLEAGMAWESKTAATSGVRTGILRAASLGAEPETDLRVLQSVAGELGPDRVAALDWVMIFNADPTGPHATPQDLINACEANFNGGGDGIPGWCNVYSPAQLDQVITGAITLGDFDDGSNATPAGDYVCETVNVIDSNWCAGDRATVNNPTANVGVAVSYEHLWVTGVLPGNGVTFSDYAVSSTLLGEQAGDPLVAPIPPIPSASGGGGGGGPAIPAGPFPWSTNPGDLVGVFDMALAPSTTAADGAMSSDTQAYAFVETPTSGVVLGADLAIDIDPATGLPGTIVADGTAYCSILIQADAVSPPQTMNGSMVLASGVNIVGVITSDANLDASDDVLGNVGTNYDDTGGLEGPDTVTVDTSVDPQTINWSLDVAGHIDQIRIVTEC